MSEESSDNSSTATFGCYGWAERGLNIEVEAEPGDHDGAEEKAEEQAKGKLEELGINPEEVEISFDEVVQEENHE